MDLLSHTRLSSELRCEYASDAKYVQGYRPLYDEGLPTLGRFFHAGIAAGWKAPSKTEWEAGDVTVLQGKFIDASYAAIEEVHTAAISKLEAVSLKLSDEEFDAETSKLVDCADLAKALVQRVFDHMVEQEDWRPVFIDGAPMIEAYLVVPDLPGWAGMQCYIDALLEDPLGDKWLIDWKVNETIPQDDIVDIDLQQSIYQKGVKALGIQVLGSALVRIRGAIPAIPKLNKPDKLGNQAVSRADCATTWEVYKARIQEVGGSVVDYLDMKEKLESKIWFRIDRALRTEEEVEGIWNRVVLPHADRIRRRQQYGIPPVRNYGSFFCNRCWFKEPCLEELRGRDPSDILRLSFRNIHEERQSDERFDIRLSPAPIAGEAEGTVDQSSDLREQRSREDDIRGDSSRPSGSEELSVDRRGRGPTVGNGQSRPTTRSASLRHRDEYTIRSPLLVSKTET